ncbi:ATP phosphoribosyltransferase regulatory subunit [Paenibacillus mucilaginosus]|uniref:ATP phosphoribosyltransferase regulatory subunit n=1 Tax=Paenibacillus mucilaginosus TaxID=61624 RepID=UPI00240DB35C|nr:ATP phosphoribosyltransferase regulatory subunit [Paenibacillus mucilaginosus]
MRGLDYYTGTVFEIQHGSAVSGGGRYNALYAELGGPPLHAAGFGVGLERTLLLLRDTGALPDAGPQGPMSGSCPSAKRRARGCCLCWMRCAAPAWLPIPRWSRPAGRER